MVTQQLIVVKGYGYSHLLYAFYAHGIGDSSLNVTDGCSSPEHHVFYQQNTKLGREASERTHPIKFLLHQGQNLSHKTSAEFFYHLISRNGYVAIHS